jgi:CRP-like cAMP-binding protein
VPVPLSAALHRTRTTPRLSERKWAGLVTAYNGCQRLHGHGGCVIGLPSAPRTNLLIAGLTDDARQRWRPRLERVEVPRGFALHESGSPMSFAYFPTTAVVSLMYETVDGSTMEFAVVGNEGVVGVELLLGGGSTPSRAVVRTGGEMLRLPARAMQEELSRSGSAAHLLLRYTLALMTQVAQTAVCCRHHALDQRLCCWLLMGLDRVQGSEVAATQEQMAHMLGVRREGVTQSALHLQALGLIRYARGRIRVLDRPGLERQACECYGVVRQEYDRLLPGAPHMHMPEPKMPEPKTSELQLARVDAPAPLGRARPGLADCLLGGRSGA